MSKQYNNILSIIKQGHAGSGIAPADSDMNRRHKEMKGRASEGVRLDFPHKDEILLGGQVGEGGRSEEFFYDPDLDHDLVSRLFSPKVIGSARKYTISGVSTPGFISSEDNLVIKGNNLIALSCLSGTYAGRVKMVYWDIPYNTGSGSLKYYDSFARSRWLVFIKNRVDQVLPLVSDDGVILIQCSSHQYSYLKVLLDEIIGNYVMTFNILVRHPERTLTSDKEYNDVIEYVLVYSKSSGYRMPKMKKEKKVDEYRYMVRELAEGRPMDFGGKKGWVFMPDEYELERLSPSRENLKVITVRGSIREKVSSGRFYVQYLQPLEGSYPARTLFKVEGIGDDMYDHRYFYLPPEGNKNGAYLQGMPVSSTYTMKPYPNYLNFVQSYNRVNKEGNVEFRNGKKPEDLLRYFMDIFTEAGDLVLDAFAGSGTTAAVALKMNRRFILCEQMDFIEDITVKRLAEVVTDQPIEEPSTDASPVDHDMSFVYFELKRSEDLFVNRIRKAEEEDIPEIWKEMEKAGYISTNLHHEPLYNDFLKMDLAEKKKLLLDVLYLTERYINIDDMEDPFYQVPPVDQQISRSFYK